MQFVLKILVVCRNPSESVCSGHLESVFPPVVIHRKLSLEVVHHSGDLLEIDRHQARHLYLAKQLCFLDADCLVVEESQGSSRRSVGKYPVKPS